MMFYYTFSSFGDDLGFVLLAESPPPVDRTFCNACGFRAPGLVYHCFDRDLDLHPTCVALKTESAFLGGHRVQLRWESDYYRCIVCGSGRGDGDDEGISSSSRAGKKFWAYRWRYGSTRGYLHAACMKRIAFQSWKQAYQVSVGGGLVEASVPTMMALLQRKQRTGGIVDADEIVDGVFDILSS